MFEVNLSANADDTLTPDSRERLRRALTPLARPFPVGRAVIANELTRAVAQHITNQLRDQHRGDEFGRAARLWRRLQASQRRVV